MLHLPCLFISWLTWQNTFKSRRFCSTNYSYLTDPSPLLNLTIPVNNKLGRRNQDYWSIQDKRLKEKNSFFQVSVVLWVILENLASDINFKEQKPLWHPKTTRLRLMPKLKLVHGSPRASSGQHFQNISKYLFLLNNIWLIFLLFKEHSNISCIS